MSELKKILMAGIGAIQTGLEKSQEVIDTLAEKGKPAFDQAAQFTQEAADTIKEEYEKSILSEVVSGKFKKETILEAIKKLDKDELLFLRDAIDELIIEIDAKAIEKDADCDEDDEDIAEEAENLTDNEEPEEETDSEND